MSPSSPTGEEGRLAPWRENGSRTGRWPALRLTEVWTFRELIGFFALRDFKVRYKQAFLGVAWAVVQPLVGAVAFTLLFHQLADIDIGDHSYFAFSLVGYAVWSYFSTVVVAGSNSLLYNADLLTKVAFPRLVLPIATLLPALVDLAIGSALGLVATIGAGERPSPVGLVIGLPVGLVLLVVTVAGTVFLFSASIVRYRDVSVLLGFGLQVVLFASPVAYPTSLVPDEWRTVMYLNPLAGSLGLLRWGLVGMDPPSAADLLLSTLTAVVILGAGLMYFRRNEQEFADII
ncbi:MAG: ABC transporter permease [Ilumatobacteraceae bacterium]